MREAVLLHVLRDVNPRPSLLSHHAVHVVTPLVLDMREMQLLHALRWHRTLAAVPLHLYRAPLMASRVVRSAHPDLCTTRQHFSTR